MVTAIAVGAKLRRVCPLHGEEIEWTGGHDLHRERATCPVGRHAVKVWFVRDEEGRDVAWGHDNACGVIQSTLERDRIVERTRLVLEGRR